MLWLVPWTSELEFELMQSHMAQKPVLRGEVGARALRVRLVSRERLPPTTLAGTSFESIQKLEQAPIRAFSITPQPLIWRYSKQGEYRTAFCEESGTGMI